MMLPLRSRFGRPGDVGGETTKRFDLVGCQRLLASALDHRGTPEQYRHCHLGVVGKF